MLQTIGTDGLRHFLKGGKCCGLVRMAANGPENEDFSRFPRDFFRIL